MRHQKAKLAVGSLSLLAALLCIVWFIGCASQQVASTQPDVGNSSPAATTQANQTGDHIKDGQKSAGSVKGILEKPSVTPTDIHSADSFNNDTITSLVAANVTNEQAKVEIKNTGVQNQTLQGQKKTLTTQVNTLKPKADAWDKHTASVKNSWVIVEIGGKTKAAFWWIIGGIIAATVIVVALDWATDGATGKAFGIFGKPIGWASDFVDYIVRLGAEGVGYIIAHITTSKNKAVAVIVAAPAPVKSNVGIA